MFLCALEALSQFQFKDVMFLFFLQHIDYGVRIEAIEKTLIHYSLEETSVGITNTSIQNENYNESMYRTEWNRTGNINKA